MNKGLRLFVALTMIATLFASSLVSSPKPVAAATSDLFFSEYIEGSSNNKALEIYNGTGAPVNLLTGNYTVELYTNGGTTVQNSVALTMTIASDDVLVIANSQANATIKAQADIYSTVTFFNGDDALVLKKNGTIIDSIGQVGFDPGTEWGTGNTSTADNTIQRKATICTGDTNATDLYDPSIEWNGFAIDTFTGLGSHTSNCSTPIDNPPIVLSTVPTNGATLVALASNITINFSEAVTTNTGWYSISCSVSGTHTATETGTGNTRTLDPTTDFVYGETCTVTVFAANVLDQDGTADPMAANYVFTFDTELPAGVCPVGTNLQTIPALQGTGDINTQNGTTVTVRGVVVGDHQGATGLYGFNIQDPTGDGNIATSDGVFIYVPAANTAWTNFDVSVGEAVQVTGRATEFQGQTEIDTVTSIVKCGTNQVLSPTVIDLPETVNQEMERYEGMLISIPETLTVDQNYFQGRYGQITLSSDGRLYNPTNQYLPGSPEAIAAADSNARRLIVLDDAFSGQNPNPIPYIGLDNTLRAGDTTSGITGTLDYGAINSVTTIRDYRIQPINRSAITFTRANPRTSMPENVGGNVKIASFNVLNYFNGDGMGGGFPTPRGANTLLEFQRQRTKIISAILAINPDVLGVMEMENDGDGPLSAIQDLVNGLNAATAPNTYAFVPQPLPTFGTDQIKVALIYKPGTVSLAGPSRTSTDPIFDRLPFAQTFMLNSNGEKFSVVMNHFKSKGSCPTDGSLNEDQGDGQGCWNLKRVQQAQKLTEFINNVVIPGASDSDVMIMGDLNAYGKENPITTLTSNGFVNEIEKHIGTTAYSYVFDGQAGYLDHALASASLDAQVNDVTEWHINADEPSVIDYTTGFKPQDLYTPTPYRSSDHDPVIVGLNLYKPGNLSGSSKSVNATTVQAGGLLTYTIGIRNSGQALTTFSLTDTLDPNLTIVSVTPAMTINGQQLSVTSSVSGGETVVYTIVVQVNSDFTGTINNSATLTSNGTTQTLTAPAVTVTPARKYVYLPLVLKDS